MEKTFKFTALGKEYTARWSEMYGYYWVTNEDGYTFKVDKDVFERCYLREKN